MVKLLHAADLHLDSAFSALPPEKAVQRRAEQRLVLERLTALSEGCAAVLLAGDLFDSARVYRDTLEALRAALAACRCPVFIAPGNHDALLPGSPYLENGWPENVHIFRTAEPERISLPELDIYGAGFLRAEMPAMLDGFRAADPSRLNILVLHGDAENPASPYDPVSSAALAASGLDYAALGHIHRRGERRDGGTLCAWPGCLMGRGFDECGEKGALLVSAEKGACRTEFVPCGARRYERLSVPAGDDALAAVRAALTPELEGSCCRIELAAEYGIRIIDTYADRAVSGRTDKRHDFQRMMTDAAKGKFRYVIAWKSNRMGRNMLEALINEARLQDLGVRVLYVEEDFDDTAAGRFAARSMMNVNQFYSENMAEDIKRGLYDNAANCMVANGHLPYGYKADETLHYAIDEPKAAVIREIFTRVSCGEAFVDIMASLNARGIKTSYGRPWGRSSFQKILSNERYRGIYIYGDVRKEGGIPRIISDELYFKVQEVITTKKNPQGRHRVNGDYLLTGKLFCGHCKSPMTGVSDTGRSGNLHYYYVCQKRRTEKTCDKKNVRRDEIELQVAQAIKDYALKDDVIEWIADSTVAYNERKEAESKVGILEDQLAGTEHGIKNIMSAIEQGIITETTKSRLVELESERATIKANIAAARADIVTVSRDDIISGLEMFRDGDVHDKKYQARLFDTFLVAVYAYDDNLRLVFSFSGNKNTIQIPIESAVNAVENNEAECSFKLCSAPPEKSTCVSKCFFQRNPPFRVGEIPLRGVIYACGV